MSFIDPRTSGGPGGLTMTTQKWGEEAAKNPQSVLGDVIKEADQDDTHVSSLIGSGVSSLPVS